MQVQHLFFSTDAEQQTLHRRITPSSRQRTLQQERWQDLRDFLLTDLAEKTGLAMRSWLQGSYKFGTQIRPVMGGEYDIDLGIYFCWPGRPEQGGYNCNQLQALVQQSLRDYARDAGDDVIEVVTPPKTRCSRIRFTADFHIDVPSYHLDVDRDARTLATAHGWEDSDPKALWVWFRGLFDDDDHAQARRLIRYFKMWGCLNIKTPAPSVLVTVLVAQAYRPLRADQADTDDKAIQGVAESIVARLSANSTILNPAQPGENLNRMTPAEIALYLDGLRGLATTARHALAAQTEAVAAAYWTSAFKHFFPAPRSATNPDAGRAIVPMAFDPEVYVEAQPRNNEHRTFSGVNRIGPIPKNCNIRFKLRNGHLLPPGARVGWIVRNEGDEAEDTNDLGHLAGTDIYVREEHSAYRGTHYMDVMVTSAIGAPLGSRRVPVEVSGQIMPARNPSRPGYTKMRRL